MQTRLKMKGIIVTLTSNISVIYTLGKQTEWCLCVIQGYNVHTKFHANWLTGSEDQMEGHTCHSGRVAHFFLV